MATQSFSQTPVGGGSIVISVFDTVSKTPLEGASVSVWRIPSGGKKSQAPGPWSPAPGDFVDRLTTQSNGQVQFDNLDAMPHQVVLHHLQLRDYKISGTAPQKVDVQAGCVHSTCFELGLEVTENHSFERDDCVATDCPREGDRFFSQINTPWVKELSGQIRFDPPPGTQRSEPFAFRGAIGKAGQQSYSWKLLIDYQQVFNGAPPAGAPAALSGATAFFANPRTPQPVSGNVGVALSRTATEPTTDTAFFRALLNSTEGLSFNTYLRFMDSLFCGEPVGDDIPDFERARFTEKTAQFNRLLPLRLLPFTDSDAYRVIKAATEAFVMINCGVLSPDSEARRPFDTVRDNAYLRSRDLPVQDLPSVFTNQYLVPFLDGKGSTTLPYLAVIRSKLPDIGIKLGGLDATTNRELGECHGILQDKLTNPCLLELIWSYWHEEGMLAQTMNAITRRFQNVRSHERDPLANLEIDPLRPLNNVLWGFVQDEQHRLSVVRRNYEYDHHYGLRLEGKAVQRMQTADSRSRFLEAFHHLLRLCAVFFKQDDDTTVKADAFPVLNALKEVHLILSQGAHNQFGDLPSTARIEMLMQQWLLARPEFREFLPTRIMTAYPEPWMDRVDAMKKLQGWTDTSVLHFRNLAIFGEQVLLTIRWGHWSDVQEPLQAFNWARLLRPQIQGYSHAYRAVTGVDLAADVVDTKVDATLPSVLLQRRLATQQRTA
jgi:hypothetical protein